ncbi:cupin domain-containing protein [Actinokineospora diospyrosa]|uniref:Cupin domain-containing protein n=1 Tax=Actinokineospora diospyrosa TaxID=103728 RepID=A0ABT1I7S6_9PSEU|nr:cupin domain-containing protein [Actinokineospora diospyrosa]MCP2268670.1 Cupin domain-containing protein [Actinokineospora diospyrosa]
MSYLGTTGELSARWRPVEEITVLDRPRTSAHFIAPGSLTNGQYGMFRWDMAPGASGPRPHFHRTFSESFYILDGAVRLFDGQRWVTATAGDFLYVPEGGVHAFGNESDEPASMLILFAPGTAREDFFVELAERLESGRELPADDWAEFYARHDQYHV